MALQTTAETFRTRFALPLDLLQAVLRDCDVAFGSLADIEAFADLVETPGRLADGVAATLRTVMSAEGMTLTRMEMLELLCIAVSGTDVESSGPALRRSLRQMLVFVNGVLLSMQEPLARAAEPQGLASTRALQASAESDKESSETPENFYVLESFELVSRHAPFASKTAPATPFGAPSKVAWAQLCEQSESIAPEAECSKCGSGSDPAQDVVAEGPPVFFARVEAAPADVPTFAGAAIARSSSPGNASIWGEDESGDSAEFVEPESVESESVEPDFVESDSAESDSAESDEPLAHRHKLLSQPALIACAAVVAFGAGMLVPRSSPPRPNAAATSERVDSARQTAGSTDAATGYSPEGSGALRMAGVPDPLPLPVSQPPVAKAPAGDAGVQGPAAVSSPPLAGGPPAEQPEQVRAEAPPASQSASVPPAYANTGVHASPATFPVLPGSQALTSVAPESALANLIYSPPPEYPTLAKLTNVEGEVVLAIAVSTHGDVVGTRVLGGQPLLRGAAERAVRHWRFRPFLEAGRPAGIQTLVAVDVRPPVQ